MHVHLHKDTDTHRHSHTDVYPNNFFFFFFFESGEEKGAEERLLPFGTEVLCIVFRSGQNHLARHSERGKKTRQTKEEVGRQHQRMDRPGVWQVPEGSGEQGKMEKTGCKIICGAPTTLALKGLMMMMIIHV